jgi:hypothetical protein
VNQLQAAMLATTMEDAIGQPCWLCDVPGANVGVWQPSPEHQRRLGAPEGKTRVLIYTLCRSCAAKPDSIGRVEDRALATAERRRKALAAGWELDGNLAHRPGDEIPDWVREALESYPGDLAGVVFAWLTDPCRCVYVRARDGEIRAICEAGHEPPDPPDFFDAPRWEPPRSRRPPAPADRRRKRKRR